VLDGGRLPDDLALSVRFPVERIVAGLPAKHWLGTDDLGYDTLTRTSRRFGFRSLLLAGVEAIVLVVGGSIGLLAGFLYGREDRQSADGSPILCLRSGYPTATLIMAIKGASLGNIFVALGCYRRLVGLARLCVVRRGMSLRRRERRKRRELSASLTATILRHILPNLLPQLSLRVII